MPTPEPQPGMPDQVLIVPQSGEAEAGAERSEREAVEQPAKVMRIGSMI